MKPYEGFIFLCGGPANVREPRPVSVRDAIYRELAKSDDIGRRIRVAEHYKDWAHDSIYRDLVSFEKHLAELSSVIVLVLESPGALAELGLFSAIDEFREKLL
ncbi:MAG: retron St85 family effector protein, partial [Acidiferrobacteraceae bacterium]